MDSIIQSPIFPMVLMFGVLYLFILRPKQKEQQQTDQMRKNLKKGDQVVTIGGIFGTIVSLDEKSVVLKLMDNQKIELERVAISRRTEETNA